MGTMSRGVCSSLDEAVSISCAAPTWVSRDIAFWSGMRRSTCTAVPTDGVIGRGAGWGTKWRKLGDGQPHSAAQSIPSSSCRTIEMIASRQPRYPLEHAIARARDVGDDGLAAARVTSDE
jgi:hypothetical protein